jgi:probable F420-dependent oxidoreductase
VVKFAIGLFGLQDWFAGDFARALQVARRADEKGVDQVNLSDHVVMGERLETYPYGDFSMPPTYPFYEPVTTLAAIASITSRIRLSAIVIAPLRPAVFLAKQLATLDVLSGGRVDIGFGVGWQKEEYDGCGVPWEGRFARMEEQIAVCRELWSQAPASYAGRTVAFERLYSLPFPVQPGGIPFWFGLPPTPRSFERIARLGGGWYPMIQDPGVLRPAIERLRTAYREHGRDPAALTVRVVLLPSAKRTDGRPDLHRTLQSDLPALVAAGVTTVEVHPFMYCRGPDEVDAFLDAIVGAKRELAA